MSDSDDAWHSSNQGSEELKVAKLKACALTSSILILFPETFGLGKGHLDTNGLSYSALSTRTDIRFDPMTTNWVICNILWRD
jgi:hypothetical protein